jgi:hypothetical protein
MKRPWERVGVVGVDAGMVWIGDPCYCVTPDASCHPAKTWMEFCDLLHEGGFDSRGHQQFNVSTGIAGLGVAVSSGYGDGVYPVYIRRNEEGRVAGVRVRVTN